MTDRSAHLCVRLDITVSPPKITSARIFSCHHALIARRLKEETYAEITSIRGASFEMARDDIMRMLARNQPLYAWITPLLDEYDRKRLEMWIHDATVPPNFAPKEGT